MNYTIKVLNYVSNNNTTFIRDLYKDFHHHIGVTYSINEQRNPVNELIITNYKTC
ncbi:putative site-specific DNA adenine methylase [Orientia tsutsugamushi str. TA716]|uniref:Putative site-specific DNA adenine methylase n=1 Tax=Orientia tsutsugamushi str. TA716 TaxID=1359175 RepID=A0A0F3NWJ6_ORITS|nr:putative site-specific DNA adenine methylase [Orientia tsutsugamushi str. TA716]